METLLEFKCPHCGGKLEFNSSEQQMKCPFCDSLIDVEALKSFDEKLNSESSDSFDWASTAGSEWEKDEELNMDVYVCQSCGGEIVCEKTTAATSCPYCENPVVLAGRLSGSLKPDYVIPFKLDKNAAKDALKKHLEGKRLLPKVFKSENHIDEIKGVYVPFWLFDADVNADIDYHGTKTRVWSDSHYRYTETSHYDIHRGGRIAFQRVPVDGSEKMPDELMESIEPFDFSEAVDFKTAYLSGYLADKYDVSAEQSIEKANFRIKNSTEQSFAETVNGFGTVVPTNSNISLGKSSSKYALYPVWLLNTTWKGQKYTFAMNGQTGKFVGNLPCDNKKMFGYLALLTPIISAAAYGAWWLISGLM